MGRSGINCIRLGVAMNTAGLVGSYRSNDWSMIGVASGSSSKRKNEELALDKEAKRGRFHMFVELVKSRGGSDDDDKASYWDLLPFHVQERIVKKSEVMEDMDKARGECPTVATSPQRVT